MREMREKKKIDEVLKKSGEVAAQKEAKRLAGLREKGREKKMFYR